jgi:hypothetical protein
MKWLFLVSAGALTVGALALSPSVASASPTSGTEHVQITSVNNQPGAVVARGVFNAGGIDYQKGNNADLLVFPNGAFTVHHPGGSGSFSLNPKTCVVKGTFTGSYTIKGGVGAFEGIGGSGTYVGKLTGVVPRNPNGTCNGRAEPVSSVNKTSASGPLFFKP